MVYEKSAAYLQKGKNPQTQTLTDIFESMPMVRIFEKSKIIYSQGDRPECFYYLKKGRVKIFITSESGVEKTLSVITSGAILGEAAFFDGRERMSSARAVVRSELVSVSKNVLTDIIRRSPQTALELLKLQAQTIRLLSAQVDSIAFLSARSRLCTFLIESTAQSGKSVINATHEEIGSIIGATRVTVSKLINDLVREGTVRTGYREIEVIDFEGLQKLI